MHDEVQNCTQNKLWTLFGTHPCMRELESLIFVHLRFDLQEKTMEFATGGAVAEEACRA